MAIATLAARMVSGASISGKPSWSPKAYQVLRSGSPCPRASGEPPPPVLRGLDRAAETRAWPTPARRATCFPPPTLWCPGDHPLRHRRCNAAGAAARRVRECSRPRPRGGGAWPIARSSASRGEPLSHYTDAVKAGGLLFVSGIVPLDADGKLVGEGDVAEQARQVFRNMELCLNAAGCGFDDVVKVVALPARRRRPAEDQPGADGVLRRGAARVHAGRGLGARRARRAARDRGGRRYPGLSALLDEPRSASLGPSSSARS